MSNSFLCALVTTWKFREDVLLVINFINYFLFKINLSNVTFRLFLHLAVVIYGHEEGLWQLDAEIDTWWRPRLAVRVADARISVLTLSCVLKVMGFKGKTVPVLSGFNYFAFINCRLIVSLQAHQLERRTGAILTTLFIEIELTEVFKLIWVRIKCAEDSHISLYWSKYGGDTC